MRYPIKTSSKEFCDTIATSIARYEKYRCWASKIRGAFLRGTSSQNDDNRRQSWTIVDKHLKPPFERPPFRLSRPLTTPCIHQNVKLWSAWAREISFVSCASSHDVVEAVVLKRNLGAIVIRICALCHKIVIESHGGHGCHNRPCESAKRQACTEMVGPPCLPPAQSGLAIRSRVLAPTRHG